MKKIFKKKYKIVPDGYAGFEIRCKMWFWPYWYQWNSINTYRSYEDAEKVVLGLIDNPPARIYQ